MPARPSALRRFLLARLPGIAGLAFALALSCVLILVIGKNPFAVAARFLQDFGPDDLGEVIFLATIYTFTGLAVAHAFRAGLFNIGGEGQLVVGGLVIGLVGASLPEGTSTLLGVPVCILACFAAGAAWAALPAVLRAFLGVHEVIATILMNLIAVPVAAFCLHRYYAVHKAELGMVERTLDVPGGARLQRLGDFIPALRGSNASTAILLAIGVAFLLHFIVQRTRGGYELRAVGLNSQATAANGIRVRTVLMKAMLVSGGLAALAAVPAVLGSHYFYEPGLTEGAGFMGIAVAILAGNDARGVLTAAFLMAFLSQAGQVVDGNRRDQVPKEIVQVLDALVILGVLIAREVLRRHVQALEARRAAASVEGSS